MNKSEITKALRGEGIIPRYSGEHKTFYGQGAPSPALLFIIGDLGFSYSDHPPLTDFDKRIRYQDWMDALRKYRSSQPIQIKKKKKGWFRNAIDKYRKKAQKRQAAARRARKARKRNRR